MSTSVISFKRVTKAFRVRTEHNSTLKEKILYAGRQKYREFVALKDVSLEIPRGVTVGLIGVNGSGKSTLLKLASRILYPDLGSVEVTGRVSSLLELGAGFHPDFTGRENIFMNGALLGLSKKEISKKLDEIVEFSELGDFIEEPVRAYSSGMYMRLAFSVAVAVDPEILLIDEILAVGDAPFQAKCMNRIRELQAKNRTILMVSHDTGSVEKFCDTAVWLHNSRIRMEGETVRCIQSYLSEVFQASRSGGLEMSFDHDEGEKETKKEGYDESEPSLRVISDNPMRWGNGNVIVEKVELLSQRGEKIVNCGGYLDITIYYKAICDIDQTVFGIGFFNSEGERLYGTNTLVDRLKPKTLNRGVGKAVFRISECLLLEGRYWIDVAIHAPDGESYDYWRRCAEIEVYSDLRDIGMFRLPHEWNFEDGMGSQEDQPDAIPEEKSSNLVVGLDLNDLQERR